MTKMIAVPATEANNYSRILTLLGMEEEGDPVVEVERLRNDLARLEREMMVWQTIDTAPRDGTRILAWNADYGQRETSMQKYSNGSPGFAKWEKGDGPLNAGWGWQEPQHNWGSTWKPTHWMPLPASPLPDNAIYLEGRA